MSKMFMMIGLPGSGKSTYANKLAEKENAIIFSSDSLRAELLGDETDQSQNGKVFEELHRRIIKALRDNQNVIFDATNVSSKKRRHFLSLLEKIDCTKIAYVFATPYEECIRRNASRYRQVPEYAIRRIYEQFNIPCYQEGFDEIEIIYPEELELIDYQILVDEMQKIPHDSIYHTLSIGAHMKSAYDLFHKEYIMGEKKANNTFATAFATLLHDIGKPIVKKFKDNIAHYYNHQNVGAYEVLLTNIPEKLKLQVALMIQYHMHPYMEWRNSIKAFEKDREFLGQELIEDLYILNSCDKNYEPCIFQKS